MGTSEDSAEGPPGGEVQTAPSTAAPADPKTPTAAAGEQQSPFGADDPKTPTAAAAAGAIVGANFGWQTVIEKQGKMFVSQLGNGTGEAPSWLKLKKANYCLLRKGAEKDDNFGQNLEKFIFKQNRSSDTPGATECWEQTPPSCFLTPVDTKVEGGSSAQQFSDNEASMWLKDVLSGLIAKDSVFKQLEKGEVKKTKSAEPKDPKKAKGEGCWCMKSPCCGKDESPQNQDSTPGDTADKEGTKLATTDQFEDYEDRLDRLLGVKEKTKKTPSEGWSPTERTAKEYRRRLEEASRALAETLGDQDAWVDVGDGNVSDLSLFLQTGLMAQWKARGSQKKQPVVFAIRIWEEKKKSSGDQEKSKLETAREAQSNCQSNLDLAKSEVSAKETLVEKTKEEFTNKTKELEEATKKQSETSTKLSQAQAANKSDEKPAQPEGEGTGEGGQDTPKEPQEVADARKAHEDAQANLKTAQEAKTSAEKAKTEAAEELTQAQNAVTAEQGKLDACASTVKHAEAEDKVEKLEEQIQQKQEEQKKQEEEGNPSKTNQADLEKLRAELYEAQKELKLATRSADAHASGTVKDLSDAIFSDPDDLSMKSPALLPCVTHVVYVRDIAQMAAVRAKLQSGKRNINFLANGHKEKLYYKLLSEARFGSMYLVFDKTGGAAQEIAWDVYCHNSEKLEIIPPCFSTCGVSIVGSEFPTGQFKVVDPLISLTKIKKMFGEILGAVQEYDDADDDGAQWERKRIQYVWEQIAIFKHNGKAFRSLGRMLQFSVVFLAFLTSATSIANTNCEDCRDKYLEIPRGDWEDQPRSFLTTICGLQESARGNVTFDSVRSGAMVQHYGELTILLPLIASIAFAILSKLNPTEKWAHLESAATALETEIYTYRSRSGRYSKQADPVTDDKSKPDPKKAAAEQGKGGNRRATFADTVRRILEDALSSDMRNDYLIPPSTAENSAYVKLYDPDEERKKNRDRQTWMIVRWTKGIVAYFKHSQNKVLLPTKPKSEFEVPLLTGENLKLASNLDLDVAQDEGGLWYGSGADYEFNPANLDGDLSSFRDDGIHELQPEQYLHARLAPMLRLYHQRAKFLGRMVKMSQVLMTLMTGTTTLFAAVKEVDLRPVVPVMVALNALVTQTCENERFQTRLVNVRKSIESLTEVQIWWSSLTSRDKQKAFAKSKLVTKTEEQADAEIAAWKKSAKVDDDSGEEEKKDDSKAK